MASSRKKHPRKILRLTFATGLGALVFIQVIAFSPVRLEELAPPPEVQMSELIPEDPESQVLATLPKDQAPEYTVEGFHYVSLSSGEKQWDIHADHAYFYQQEGIVHTQKVHALIYGKDGQGTSIEGKEAKYFLSTGDLEIFGDVLTIFPNGLKTKSQYMKFQASTHNVEIPPPYLVEGWSDPTQNQDRLQFQALGMHYQDQTQKAQLLNQVKVFAKVVEKNKKTPETTTIFSDTAFVDRNQKTVLFSMRDTPQEIRFVEIKQPGMKCESRRAEFKYGAKEKKLRKVIAQEEVKIEEIPQIQTQPSQIRSVEPIKRYATAGEAEFDTIKNLIILREFPQVYQDHDTITGEVITLHRTSNLVEVTESNAITTLKNENGE